MSAERFEQIFAAVRKTVAVVCVLFSVYTAIASAENTEDPRVAEALAIHGRVVELSSTGRHADAIPHAERILLLMEQAYGPEHPDVATSLNNLAFLYKSTGRFALAEALYKRSLSIDETVSEPVSMSISTTLNNLAELYRATGRYAEAEPLYLKSTSIREKLLGPEHLDVAANLSNLAALYLDTARHSEAVTAYERVLSIYGKALDASDPRIPSHLHALADLYFRMERYEEAEQRYMRTISMREKIHGPEHPDVATSLNNLGALYQATGRSVDAEQLLKRALSIREKAFDAEHPAVAASLSNLAALHESAGRYADAEPLLKRALSIREKVFGPEAYETAMSLSGLAELYERTGRHADAEPLQRRYVGILEKTLGPEHPDVATGLNTLAMRYYATGRFGEAEPLFAKSLAIREKALGPEHPDVAAGLNNLGALYEATIRYSEAEPFYRRALAIREKAHGPEHPEVATSLNNLAALFGVTGRNALAEPLYKRALAIREKSLGPDHPDVAAGLNNLAMLYLAAGRFAEAEPLCTKALTIWEKVSGPEHSDTAAALNNLAEIYKATGRYSEAAPLYARSLAILEKTFGSDHFDVATGLSNIGLLHAATGRHLDGHDFFARSQAVHERMREKTFLLLTEQQKLKFMMQTGGYLQILLSHGARFLQSERAAVTGTLNAWLRWKGAVAETQGRYMEAAMQSGDPAVQQRLSALNEVRRELARHTMAGPAGSDPDAYRRRLDELVRQKDAQEAELSRVSRDFALQKQAGEATAKSIRRYLPQGSVYIDYARILMYDFRERKWDTPQYLAFVLDADNADDIKLMMLGDARKIELHVRNYASEMERAAKGELPNPAALKREATALYELLVLPFESSIKGKKQLLVSPDGALNLIPFEVLMDSAGRMMLEDYRLSYVGAGRDIIRFGDTAAPESGTVIIADPDYNLGMREKEKAVSELRLGSVVRGTLSRDTRGMRFSRLRDTKREADAIEKTLERSGKAVAGNYQGRKALEEILFGVRSPVILHIAAHGYFLKDQTPEQMDIAASPPGLSHEIENPMLRSGIVLAGANSAIAEGRDDGLVSAEKVLGLRLRGTDLVVLSACETGVGDVQNGEGVLGLKRAFILSGARSLVMSLWSVPSRETTELMIEFYRLLAMGHSKAEALRHAKLSMIRTKPNPFYWGAFVLTGKPD